MNSPKLILSGLLGVVFFVAPAVAQQVLRVDALGTGGAFTDIQPAVDAATDGDVILVASGAYSSVFIDGQSLRIIADSGATPSSTGSVAIRNLSSAQSVEIHGLRLFGVSSGMSVRSCDGPVLVQDCSIERVPFFSFFFVPAPGLDIQSSSAVTVVNTVIDTTGSVQVEDTDLPPTACLSRNSNLYMYDCELTGGQGVTRSLPTIGGAFPPADGNGAPGLRVRGGTALLSKNRIEGGPGGVGDTITVQGITECSSGGPGGNAIQLRGGALSPVVTMVDNQLFAGPGGLEGTGCGVGSSISTLIDILFGSIVNSPVLVQRLAVTPVVRPGDTIVNSYTGGAFDLAWVVFSATQTSVVFSPTLTGAIYPGSPNFIRFLGSLNSVGVKTTSFTFTDTGLDVIPLYEQAFYFNATDGFTASNPRFVTLLGSTIP